MDKATYVLSVSKEVQQYDACLRVAKSLKDMGISLDVAPNFTVIDGRLEYGCKVTFQGTSSDLKNIWNHLKSKYDYNCAHVRKENNFGGCIYDYMRDSNCPTQ